MKKYKKVLVGLDIGTNSVGWCVTDENSQIIKKNGKSLWGYRGFEEGESAEERRLYRTSRRRLNRRKERIDLLREIFKDEINKIDNSFFFRLDNAFYKHEDRDSDFNYTIFNDKNYTDKDFYKKYPTIYHLRYQLINSNKKEDIRLIYLALHHIIKYRGNFLYGSDEFKPLNEEQCDKLFEFINEELKEYNKELNYNKEVFYKLKEVNGSFLKLSELKDKYNDILNTNNDKYLKNCIIPLMVGAEVALAKTGLKNIENNAKLCVKNEEFDSQLEALINDNPTQDKLINIFSICKQIFEFFLIGKLLGDNVYISKAMIDKYNNHKEQLSKLKKYVKEKHPEKYNLIFRTIDEKNNNYAHYVGSTIYNNKTSKRCSHITQDDFYNFLKKELNISDKSEDEYLLEVFDLMIKENF